MIGGFSFCGVDIADIGLEYAPDNNNTYVYAPAVSNIHEEIFDAHDGGYFYGASRQPKEFVLRCFYEQKHIAKGLMTNLHNAFPVGKTGPLIFKRRQWCYYNATVVRVDISDMRNYLNGLVVITMKAYYPFARGIEFVHPSTNTKRIFSNTISDLYHDDVMKNTGILDKDIAPPTTFTGNAIKYNTVIPLFNPGTERASVALYLAGSTDKYGVVIANQTTGQNCRFQLLTSSIGYVYSDGISGKTIAVKSGVKSPGFIYHDYGFIELAPGFPTKRNIYVTVSGKVVTANNTLYGNDAEREWYNDKYIYLNGGWCKIQKATGKHTLQLYATTTTVSNLTQTCVAMMNEIVIMRETTSVSLSEIRFIYRPTYS